MNQVSRALRKIAQDINQLNKELVDLQATNRTLEKQKDQLNKDRDSAAIQRDIAHLDDKGSIDAMQGRSKSVLTSLLKRLEQISDYIMVFSDKAQLKQLVGSMIPWMQKDLDKLDEQFFNYKKSSYSEDIYRKNIELERVKNKTLQDEIDKLVQELQNQVSPLSQIKEQALKRQDGLKKAVRPIVSEVQLFMTNFENFIDKNTLSSELEKLSTSIKKTIDIIDRFEK